MTNSVDTAPADLFRALGVLAEPPDDGHARVSGALGLPGVPSAADYAGLFLFQCYPYASVYLGPEGMMGGEARDRVAGFWRALRLVPPAEPDHLASLLGLYAALIGEEAQATDPARGALRRESRRALLREHLLSWLPGYLDKVRDLADARYRRWAALLVDALAAEADELGTDGPLPLQLRLAPALPAEDAGGRAWLEAILAPVRSGLILTRADLARAARELGLGARMGERAFILRSLFEQDRDGTAGWLVAEAGRSADRHREREPALGPLAAFWRARAEGTQRALGDLAAGSAVADGAVR